MLGRGARGYLSAEWLARWTCFAVLLEFLMFSTGSASSSTTAYDDQIYSIGDSLNRVAETHVHGISRCFRYPASPEFQLPKGVLVGTSSVHALNGLQNLVRKIFATVRVFEQIRFGIADSASVRPAGNTAGRGSGSRKLLLKGFTATSLSSSSRRYACPPIQQHPKERLMMEETTTLTAEQTQQVSLGPPAPKGLVQNEKQDWNQDYAEPDVHPPSSN